MLVKVGLFSRPLSIVSALVENDLFDVKSIGQLKLYTFETEPNSDCVIAAYCCMK